MKPSEKFRCRIFGCRIRAEQCIMRQAARKKPFQIPAFIPCGTGQCDQGKQVRRSLPKGYHPPPFRENRTTPDLCRQRQAKLKWYREHLLVELDAPLVSLELVQLKRVKT